MLLIQPAPDLDGWRTIQRAAALCVHVLIGMSYHVFVFSSCSDYLS